MPRALRRRSFASSKRAFASTAISLLLATGCQTSRTTSPPTGRCQVGICIDKRELIPSEFAQGDAAPTGGPSDEPVWFARTTVLGDSLPQGVSLAPRFVGQRRTRWEVTENYLILRDVTDGPSSDGSYPVYAVFRIDAQFDPATAALRCSEVDCPIDAGAPWYQMPFVRIDWSQDLVDEHFTQADGNAAREEPMALYESDPTAPYAPHFQCASGPCGGEPDASSSLVSIAATNRALASRASADGGTPDDAAVDAAGAPSASVVTLLTEVAREPF